jgi:hypothetical protein
MFCKRNKIFSIYSPQDTGVGKEPGAVMVQKHFQFKRQLEHAFIEILPGASTIAVKYGYRLLPPAYAFIETERLILSLTHFKELFILFAVFITFSIACFTFEFLLYFYNSTRRNFALFNTFYDIYSN